MSKKNKPIHEMVDEYEASSGYKLHNFLLNINYILYTFSDNYRELLKHVTKYEKATISKQKNTEFKEVTPSRAKSRNYLKKFVKYLHNYTASVYSVGEYYKDNNFNRFAEIKKNPLDLFVFALRNHLTHHAVPSVSISVKYSRGGITGTGFFISSKGIFGINKSAITLDHRKKVELGRNYKSKFIWNQRLLGRLDSYISKNYRGVLSIDLKKVVSNHYKLFQNYVKGFNNRLIEEHKTQYYKTKKLHQDIIKKQSSLFKKK